jgi:hypothetical protein
MMCDAVRTPRAPTSTRGRDITNGTRRSEKPPGDEPSGRLVLFKSSRFYESARLEITARAVYASAKSSGLNIGSEILSNKKTSIWLLQGANRILAALQGSPGAEAGRPRW